MIARTAQEEHALTLGHGFAAKVVEPGPGQRIGVGERGVGDLGLEQCVHEAEGLVGVEREYRPRGAVAEHPGDAIQVRVAIVPIEGGGDGAQEAARGQLDLAAVEQERASGRAHRAERRLHEAGLADASRSMDVGDDER